MNGEVRECLSVARAQGLRGPAPVEPGEPGTLSFYEGPGEVPDSLSSLILARSGRHGQVFATATPKLLFCRVAPVLFPPPRPRLNYGAGVEIGPSTHIGGEGFGWVWDEEAGGWARFPHYAGVRIEDDVIIGAGTTIDRGSLADTVIGTGTRIDNLVHIGHGAWIGPHCVIVSGVVIGGSAVLEGENQIGMGALIRDHIRLGRGAVVSMGAVVTQDVPAGGHVTGNLAIDHARFMRRQKELAHEGP